MKLIIGLGNPGAKYLTTWHNLGFIAIDDLAKTYDFPIFFNKLRFKAEISKGQLAGEEILLAKPQTFMNNSGESVAALCRFYKIKPEDIIVIHDDVDLALGKIRIAKDSSSGGHNGVKSIIELVGTQDFVRIKIGCRTPLTEKVGALDYVLQRIGKAETTIIETSISKANDAALELISGSLASAMNKFN